MSVWFVIVASTAAIVTSLKCILQRIFSRRISISYSAQTEEKKMDNDFFPLFNNGDLKHSTISTFPHFIHAYTRAWYARTFSIWMKSSRSVCSIKMEFTDVHCKSRPLHSTFYWLTANTQIDTLCQNHFGWRFEVNRCDYRGGEPRKWSFGNISAEGNGENETAERISLEMWISLIYTVIWIERVYSYRLSMHISSLTGNLAESLYLWYHETLSVSVIMPQL